MMEKASANLETRSHQFDAVEMDMSNHHGGGEQRKIIEILWTGGFDSTLRIVQLSRCDVIIQPYYLSDKRKSEHYELRAIEEITKLLQNRMDTICTFKPLTILDMSERKENSSITEAYHRLRKTDFFGSQYEWLACFAIEHPGIELSIHKDDKATLLIEKYGAIKRVQDDVIDNYYVVDMQDSQADISTLFCNYHLPLIGLSKVDMKKIYEEYGCSEIADKTWFCYHPILGKPCGRCNPCKYAIEEGMKERFPWWALLLNKISR